MGRTVTLLLIFLLLLSTLSLFLAKAESHNVTVPDDYPTIAAAIGNSSNGDTIFIREGIYQEHTLVINKSITLIGEDANTTKIQNIDPIEWDRTLTPWPVYPDTIKIKANNVKIADLTIAGQGVGITGSMCNIEITGNIIEASGIELGGTNRTITKNIICSSVTLEAGSDSIIAENFISGSVHVGYTLIPTNLQKANSNLVYNNTITGLISVRGDLNTVVQNIAGGVSVSDGNFNDIYLNTLTNGAKGIYLGKGFNNQVYANHIACNWVGAVMQEDSPSRYSFQPALENQTGNNTIYHNNFGNNTFQVQRANSVSFIPISTTYDESQPLIDYLGKTNNHYDNGAEGNYWSDYKVSDSDSNSIGDEPYMLGNALIDRYPLMSPFDYSTVGNELPEWATIRLQSESPTVLSGLPVQLAVVIAVLSISLALGAIGVFVYFKKHRR
jgi:nitrous oxidase accessory protein